MPRDSKTDPVTLDVDDLPELTDRQAEFVTGVLQGLTAVDAYRRAYTAGGNQRTSQVAAWRLRHSPGVAAWIRAGRLAGAEQAADTYAEARMRHLADMSALAEAAEASGNYGAAVQARKAVGQVLGMYVERHEHAVEKLLAPSDIVQAVETLLGPDAARKAAVRLGQPVIIDVEPHDSDEEPRTRLN